MYGYGIYFGGGLSQSDGAVIADNKVSGVRDYGLRIDSRGKDQPPTNNVTLLRNIVHDSSPGGLLLWQVTMAVVTNNTFVDSGSLDGEGIPPQCQNCVLNGNTARGDAPPSIWSGDK